MPSFTHRVPRRRGTRRIHMFHCLVAKWINRFIHMSLYFAVFLISFVVLTAELFVVYLLQKQFIKTKPRKQFRNSLEQVVRYEKELQRYIKCKKNTYEIGLMYERYIGYLLEKDSYSVEYHGATKGMRDLGIDLIAKDKKETLIIQTKYWGKTKVITEQPIEHLAKITDTYKEMYPQENKVKAVFFATINLSQEAEDMAVLLEVKFIKMKFDNSYPMIKCNISSKGEKIFHLPTDDYYDKIKIDHDKGEFYAKTVAEAVGKGFRRAFRHKPKPAA